jgi:GMP synthase (glutamine-hydrolysing)
VFELGVPVLGICYGQQVMMQMLGGRVERGHGTAEFGRALSSRARRRCRCWRAGSPPSATAGETGLDEPRRPRRGNRPGFNVYGTSTGAPFAIIADPDRRFYAVQFHPEVHHTPGGRRFYENFVREAGFTGDWTMGAYKDEAIAKIRAQVGDARVICGLSGGVDSSVAAVLIHEAIGDQLTCVFVDHGLLRLGEAEQVVGMFRDSYNIPLIHADESRPLSRRAGGRFGPEKKRKIIGGCSSRCSRSTRSDVGGADFWRRARFTRT